MRRLSEAQPQLEAGKDETDRKAKAFLYYLTTTSTSYSTSTSTTYVTTGYWLLIVFYHTVRKILVEFAVIYWWCYCKALQYVT